MNEAPTITKFFDWLAGHSDPENAARLRDEWISVPMRYNFAVAARDPSEWPQLIDEYDERIGIMTEGRQITDEDMLAAWESVLNKKNIMEDGNYELPAQHNTRRSAANG